MNGDNNRADPRKSPILRYFSAVKDTGWKYRLIVIAAALVTAFIYITISADSFWNVILFLAAFLGISVSFLPAGNRTDPLFKYNKLFVLCMLMVYGVIQFVLAISLLNAINLRVTNGAEISEIYIPHVIMLFIVWFVFPAVFLLLMRYIRIRIRRREAADPEYSASVRTLRSKKSFREKVKYLFSLFKFDKNGYKAAPSDKRKLTLSLLLIFLSAVLLGASFFLKSNYPGIGFTGILFTIRYSAGAFNSSILASILQVVYAVLLIMIILFLLLRSVFTSRELLVYDHEKSSIYRKYPMTKKLRGRILASSGLLLFLSVVVFIHSYGIDVWLINKTKASEIYEDNYIAPTSDRIIFPEKKKNLIFIYLESMENTFSSYDNGGDNDTDYIPELSRLAKENVSFSHRSEAQGIGGPSVFFPEVAYTMGSTVAQTAGIALVSPMSDNQLDGYSEFLPGVRRLEDILHENGYNQMFIRGEDTTFAGYNHYIGRYENSTIFDVNTAKARGLIPQDYDEQWGYEDIKLYEFARDLISDLAAEGEPFAATLYTADTHGFEGGYKCPECDPSITNNYSASVRCSSLQTYKFIEWLSEQPYYEDTVIILIGDHLSMYRSRMGMIKNDDYVRTTYNCIINADKEPVSKYNRVFCSIDMFPTTLSALGCTIVDDRLGLGTDLFSGTPTLCEEMGGEQFAEVIQQDSEYYYPNFWLMDN
ncbi:MAG: sulfatase-like hydrolase/transferase [Ruminococcus sp.]|nr:sulfatase-like hydrolase/transferase [Ruminococcus sp.]